MSTRALIESAPYWYSTATATAPAVVILHWYVRFSQDSQPLIPGMIVSNEPGYYEPGNFGIRIENLLVVVEKPELGQG